VALQARRTAYFQRFCFIFQQVCFPIDSQEAAAFATGPIPFF